MAKLECAKLPGPLVIVGFVGLVPSFHQASVGPIFSLVGISWVQIFSRGYFVGSNFFLVGILWVQHFLSWVFRGSKNLSRGYFVVPKFSLQDTSWVTRECISEE